MTPCSTINIEQLKLELQNHENQNFVSYITNCFINGFDTKVQKTDLKIRECRNLRSALLNMDTVDELLSKEVEKRFLAGPYKAPSFESFRVSPLGIAEHKDSKKKRLIVDLSALTTMKLTLI